MQVEHKNLEPIHEGVMYPDPGGKLPSHTLQIPSRPIGIGSDSYDEHMINTQHSFFRGCSSGGGLARGLSFKNKTVILDGERSSLLNPELGRKSDSRVGPENAVLSNFVAAFSWKRCASLPATPASNLPPSSTSTKEKTTNEQQTPQVSSLISNIFVLLASDGSLRI